MHLLGPVDRKAIGLGFAVFVVLMIVGVLIVGGDPDDTMSIVFWPAAVVGYAVSMFVVFRETRPDADK